MTQHQLSWSSLGAQLSHQHDKSPETELAAAVLANLHGNGRASWLHAQLKGKHACRAGMAGLAERFPRSLSHAAVHLPPAGSHFLACWWHAFTILVATLDDDRQLYGEAVS